MTYCIEIHERNTVRVIPVNLRTGPLYMWWAIRKLDPFLHAEREQARRDMEGLITILGGT